MKISKVELFHVSVPLDKPFYPTWIPGYPQTHNNFTLIRLTTKCGIEGWSAGSAMGRERQGLGDLIGGYLIGLDPEDMDSVNQRLKEAGYLGWRNYWIEPAFWDIVGKSRGKPVYEVLGGGARDVEVYCSTGEMHEPEQRVEELLEMRERGYKTAKLRVKNYKLEDDIRHVEVVRKGLGDKLELGVDANQGWLVTLIDKIPAWDLDRAVKFADACADNDIAWIEEPLDSRDYDGLAALRNHSRVPIAGAELNYGWDEVKVMLEKGSLDVYQPDATFCGITQAVRIMKSAREKGFDFTPHTWTNGIGLAVNLQVYLSHPANTKPLEYPLEEPSWIPKYRDGLIKPWVPDSNGIITPPTRPGLGFEIDKRQLRRYAKRFFSLTETGLMVKVVMDKGIKGALDLKKRKQGG